MSEPGQIRRRLRNVLSVTAVRLSIAYTLIFTLVAVAIVIYMTTSTANLLRRQIQDSVDQEVGELVLVFDVAGINGLMRRLERNAAAPGANLYVVADPAGLVFAGNVRELQDGVIDHEGWSPRPFEYSRFEEGERTYYAVARIVELPNGMRLLVGRDLGEPERFRAIVGRALAISIFAMALVGLLTWILVGRRALLRLESVSRSTSRIMAGDRKERLPVSGAGDEFDTLSERLNAMLDRIGQLDEGLKQVSDNIAHDLKTPLTRLRNKAETALVSPEAASRDLVNEMVGDIDQIIRTFNALLMISRVESGSSAAELSRQDLGAIVTDVCELYEPVAEEEGIGFSVQVETGVVVQGNRELLGQALSNLIDNALKYGRSEEAGGEILVTLRRQGQDAVVTVADRGPGILPEDRARAVERFARLERSRNQPGNGLGLSLVRAVAQLHGGVLEFADHEPGLQASIRLPVAGEAGR